MNFQGKIIFFSKRGTKKKKVLNLIQNIHIKHKESCLVQQNNMRNKSPQMKQYRNWNS